MRAIVLAAGIGKRLKPFTDTTPKCLITIGTQTLIERYINSLRKEGICEIVLVVGHLAHLIRAHVENIAGTSVTIISNPNYMQGNVTSVFAAKDYFNEDCVLMDADVYFNQDLLHRLVASENNNCFLLDSTVQSTSEEMMLGVKNNRVMAISRNVSSGFDFLGEGVGFAKISKKSAEKFLTIVKQFIDSGKITSEYEECLNELVKSEQFGYERVDGLSWTEIDFLEDIQRANQLFSRR